VAQLLRPRDGLVEKPANGSFRLSFLFSLPVGSGYRFVLEALSIVWSMRWKVAASAFRLASRVCSRVFPNFPAQCSSANLDRGSKAGQVRKRRGLPLGANESSDLDAPAQHHDLIARLDLI
jgi:hypothetical protein